MDDGGDMMRVQHGASRIDEHIDKINSWIDG